MLASMFGFLVVTVYAASGRMDLSWGIAADFVFVSMFIASVLSITPPWIGSREVPPIAKELESVKRAARGPWKSFGKGRRRAKQG